MRKYIRRARHASPLLSFLPPVILLNIFLSCAPGPKIPPDTAAVIPAPFNLTVDAQNGMAISKWQIARDAREPIAGYNIYCQPADEKDTSISATPYNHVPYPGDTDGDILSESFEIGGIENGREYVAFVRTIGLNNRFSAVSISVIFAPIIRGEFTISSNHLREGSGYSFEKMKSTVARDPENDIYLYDNGERIGLSSPHRLGAGLRHTKFGKPTISVYDLETIEIQEGEIIWVFTRMGNVNLLIYKIERTSTKTDVTFQFDFGELLNKSP